MFTLHISAAEYLAKLNANADAFYADAITFDEFGAQNRTLWGMIDADGLHDDVCALWRKR